MPDKSISSQVKLLVHKRAQGCCEYCLSQEKYATHSFSIEHILPRSKGGSDDPSNLALACQGCNNFKYTKTTAPDPDTGKEASLYNPRKDSWSEHFRWNDNFTVILGLTPTGRATVKTLRLNRDFLLNQRAIYRAYGVHPPEISGN